MPFRLEAQDRRRLREVLQDIFSLQELKTLLFDCGNEWDNFPHNTVLELVPAMIAGADRQGWLDQLVGHAAIQRPENLFLVELRHKLLNERIQHLRTKARSAQNARAYDAAKEYLEQALELDPHDQGVGDQLTELLKQQREHRVQEFVRQAESALKAGQFIEAEKLAQDALDLDGQNQIAQEILHQARQEIDKVQDEPIQRSKVTPRTYPISLPTVLKPKPSASKADVLVAQGISAFNAEIYEEAIELFKEALQKEPQNKRGQEWLKKAEQKYRGVLLQQLQKYVEDGRTAEAGKQYAVAIIYYERALRLGDKHTELKQQVDAAQILSKLEACQQWVNWQKAVEWAEGQVVVGAYSQARAAIVEFTNEEARLFRQRLGQLEQKRKEGQKFLSRGDFDQAQTFWSQVIEASPRDREAQKYLDEAKAGALGKQAETLAKEEKYEEAIATLMEARVLSPNNEPLRERQSFFQTQLKLKQAMLATLSRAEKALQEGDYAQARHLFGELLGSRLESIHQKVLEGFSRASEASKQAEQIFIEDTCHKIEQVLTRGNLAEAEALYQQVSEKGNNYPDRLSYIQASAEKLHQYRQAEKWLELAQQAIGHNLYELAQENLVSAKQNIFDGQKIRLATLQKEVEIGSKLAQARLVHEQGSYESAIEILSDVLRYQSDHSEANKLHQEAHVRLASQKIDAALVGGEFDKAESVLREAQLLCGSDNVYLTQRQAEIKRRKQVDRQTRTLVTISKSAMAAGSYAEALDYLNKALSQNPDNQVSQALLDELNQKVREQREEKIAKLKEEAEQALNARNLPLAITYCENIQELDAKHTVVETLCAKIKQREKDWATVQYCIKQGKDRQQRKDWAGAIQQFAEAQRLMPEYQEVEQLLAEAVAQQRIEEEQKESLEIVQQALSNGNYALALRESLVILRQSPYDIDGHRLEQVAWQGFETEIIKLLSAKKHEDAQQKVGQLQELIPHYLPLEQLTARVEDVCRKEIAYRELEQKLASAASLAEQQTLLEEALEWNPLDNYLLARYADLRTKKENQILVTRLRGQIDVYLAQHNYLQAEAKCQQALVIAGIEQRAELEILLENIGQRRVSHLQKLRQEADLAQQARRYEEAKERYQEALNLVRDDELVREELSDRLRAVSEAESKMQTVWELLDRVRQIRREKEYRDSPVEIYREAQRGIAEALTRIPDHLDAKYLDELNRQELDRCETAIKNRAKGRGFLRHHQYEEASTYLQESVDLFERLGLERERQISMAYLQLAKEKLAEED